ncbi:MAG: alpha/beta fold hydrolase [Paracoccaceae bacterium]
MSEPVVLIPGLMADARLFLPQMVALGARHSFQVCLPVGGQSVEDISSLILAQVPQKFALVGHGLGGAVALDIIRRAPERVTRVVLMATDPLAETPVMAAAREARIVAARAGRLGQAMAEEIPAAALAPAEWRDDVLALIRDMAFNLGEGVFLRQSRALQRRPDQQKTLRKSMLPTLVIAGMADTVVPLRRAEFLAGIMPFATLHPVADAGHLPSLEQPEEVSEALARFLSGPVLLK